MTFVEGAMNGGMADKALAKTAGLFNRAKHPVPGAK
jgi:hypothetical protein